MLTCFSPSEIVHWKVNSKSGEAGWSVDWRCGYAGLLLALLLLLLLLSDSWQHMLTPASIRTPHLITRTPCICPSFITPSISTPGPLHHSHMRIRSHSANITWTHSHAHECLFCQRLIVIFWLSDSSIEPVSWWFEATAVTTAPPHCP